MMQKIVMKDKFEQDWIRMFTHLANLILRTIENQSMRMKKVQYWQTLTLDRTHDGQPYRERQFLRGTAKCILPSFLKLKKTEMKK